MTAWAVQNLVWASAAMLLVLAIRRPVAWAFGSGVAYALWLIPLARLIAPPIDWFGGMLPSAELPPVVTLIDGGGGAATAGATSVPWLTILTAAWLAGAILLLVVQALVYRHFLRRLGQSARAIGMHRGVPVIESDAADGPLALGLIGRRIVVPLDFSDRFLPSEQALALDHERYHHRRGDILANHVALIVLALNWFNPIAWLAFRAFRADQELSCDAAIAAMADAQGRSDYGRALVKAASRPGLIAVCPLNHVDHLKRRLKMLSHHRKDRRRLLAGSAVTMGLLATSLIVGTPGIAQPSGAGAEKQERRERIIIMDRHDGPAAGSGAATTERRQMRIRRGPDGRVTTEGLDPEIARHIEDCRDENRLVNVDEGEGDRRTRVMVCTRGEGSGTNQVEALQRARERIAQGGELSAETRQRVLSEIDQAIARARRN